MVADYGRSEQEYQAITRGTALVDLSPAGRLELLGADRQRFLNGLATCDVKGLGAGQGAYGFFTNAQGKILADAVILALADRLWLRVPPGRGRALSEHLRKYLIADRVEVLPLADMLPLSLVGPGAEGLMAAHAELPAKAYDHSRAEIAGIEVCLVREPVGGQPAFTLWASASVAAGLAESLLGLSGVSPAGLEPLERARVEAGWPAFGADFGADHFPQETGLEERAVSYTKGCYLGQEVIARIHYRGKANRAARRLLFDGAEPPPRGCRLLFDGEEVGRAGSAAVDAAGRALGIAVLHRKAYEPGTRLALEGGGEAVVAELEPAPPG
jgi:folate-binding protein YgfZ